ncbi:MAG TPA: metalloregulator ArsR/SmtB family transcription factor [Gemmatimonadaceae bacterium]|nr:metalloregulator ArsR/SmtB family transcription factor [Gemmatimonadaceae bacterium]
MKKSPLFDRLSALADPIRARLLLALERHELTVGELCASLQLPQSTVSRHLRSLADAGWVASRGDGTSNRYRMAAREITGGARRLWQAVRDDVGAMAAAQRDAERVRGIIAARHRTSERFFASSAAQWDRLRAELFGERTELYALLGLLDPRWTVGDLGCGTGQLTDAMAPFVERVVAVDESPAMLRAARARLAHRRNVDVRQGTLEELPVEPGELDAAALSLVLHYVAEPAQALARVRHALAARGVLLVVDMLPHDRAEFRETMGHLWQGFAPEQIRRWGEEAGFGDCRAHPLPPSLHAKGPNLFVAVLRTH